MAFLDSNDLALVEARLRRMEDIEAIKQLKFRYAALCDADYDADGIAALFTEDAVWDGGILGRSEGREAIRGHFRASPAAMPFAIHHTMNPIIEVDGDRATGQWNLWQPCTAAGGRALWMAGRYDERYRREAEQWRFESLELELRMLSPYEEGWARTPIVGRAQNAE